jgi:uncharacterized damage-inducible protein DinB
MSDSNPPEPWLRGPLPGIDPLVAPVLLSFAQVREDLARWIGPLTDEQVWARPGGLAPVGFQLRHMARSVDRLTTYLEGRPLNAAQLAELRSEMEPGAGRDDLLAEVRASLERAGAVVSALDPARLRDPREVGRARLPTTVIGLAVHLAEHTQRHLGQAIVTAKLAASG